MEDGRRLRLFFDADVLIAGSASTSGASFLLLHLADLRAIEGITSQQAVREAERNLMAKLPAAVPAFRVMVASALRVVDDPSPRTLRALRGRADAGDLPILGAAMESEFDYLVTFNVRHFPRSDSPPRPIRPGDLVSRLRELLAEQEGER